MTCSKTKKRCNSANNCSILIFIFMCSLCNSITAFELGVVDEEKTTPADWNVHDTNKRTFSNDVILRRRLVDTTAYCESVCEGETNNDNCYHHAVQHSSQVDVVCDSEYYGDGKSCMYDKRYRSSDSCDAFCGRMMGTACRFGHTWPPGGSWCKSASTALCSAANRYICECEVPTCNCCPPGRYSSTASTMEQAVLHASQASTTTKIVKRQSTVVSPVFQVHTVLLVPHNANHVAKDSMLQH